MSIGTCGLEGWATARYVCPTQLHFASANVLHICSFYGADLTDLLVSSGRWDHCMGLGMSCAVIPQEPIRNAVFDATTYPWFGEPGNGTNRTDKTHRTDRYAPDMTWVASV